MPPPPWVQWLAWLEEAGPGLLGLTLVVSVGLMWLTLGVLIQLAVRRWKWVRRGAAMAVGVMIVSLLVTVLVCSTVTAVLLLL